MDTHLLFIALSCLAAVLYALQNALLAKYSRRIGGLSTAVYRNLSFIITMSPVLFFVEFEEIQHALSFWPLFLFMGATGALALSCTLSAQRSLPISIVTIFGQASPLFLLLWSFLFLGEEVSFFTGIFIFLVMAGTLFLAFQNHHLPHLDGKQNSALLLMLVAVFLGSIGFFAVAQGARLTNPLVTGYFWEVSVGIFALLFSFFRSIFFKIPLHRVSKKEWGQIALMSSPTILASICLPFAMTLGNPGIASVILSSVVIVMSIFFGIFLYKEHLKKAQIFPILLLVLGIIGITFTTL